MSFCTLETFEFQNLIRNVIMILIAPITVFQIRPSRQRRVYGRETEATRRRTSQETRGEGGEKAGARGGGDSETGSNATAQ